MKNGNRNDYRGLILPSEPQYERKASGYIIMDDGNGPVETAATLRCCHGGENFISIKGSGKRRGWCIRCMGVTCGSHEICSDWRRRLEDYEKGKTRILI
jgi:hypothetical protein